MIEQIHHVAILTHDIEAAVDHYVEMLGCVRKESVDVERPGLRWRTVLLPIGGDQGTTALQLIEPLEGPGRDQLEAQGKGTIFEIGFKTSDVQSFGEVLKSRGAMPAGLDEQPLSEPCLTSNYGNRYFIIAPQHAHGTRLEFVEFRED